MKSPTEIIDSDGHDGIIPQDDRRVTFTDDIWRGVMDYANAEKKRAKENPLLVELITPKSIVQHIVRNELQKRHYWPREKKY
jgi:hypothetical protein